ncbi:NUDIX domain-containing protein [Terribacillus aidingensis]|uniref:NUDIX hydrolase n=1 Tax=Terribacillus aidingensis TaxID=586416 RepID=UPI00344B44DC
MVDKVLAYILSNRNNTYHMLVHEHMDFPEAGLQIPGGTVAPGENLLTALHREIFEESGLRDLPDGELVASAPFLHPDKHELQHRHFFLILIKQQLPDAWDHRVFGNGADNGLVFRYRWYDIQSVPPLAASQDQFLHVVRVTIQAHPRS